MTINLTQHHQIVFEITTKAILNHVAQDLQRNILEIVIQQM